MPARSSSPSRAWSVVIAIGVLIELIVGGLQLFPRLYAAQAVLDRAGPAFQAPRVAGASAGIELLSQVTDVLDPIATLKGGATQELPALARLIPPATLAQRFPHLADLLGAAPLTAVARELPGLVDQLLPDVLEQTPQLAQTALALPNVAAGWRSVPGIAGLTRFDGTPVVNWPQVRTYLQEDLIPLLAREQARVRDLGRDGGVGYLAPLLAALGLALILAGAVLRRVALPRRVALGAWGAVAALGAALALLVVVVSLFARLSSGQQLLDALRPAFTQPRIAGDAAAMRYGRQVVLATDPIVQPGGGAAGQVPTFARLYASDQRLSPGAAATSLNTRYGHTASLLRALPLSAVNGELPALVTYLGGELGLSPGAALTALGAQLPALGESIDSLGLVVNGWYAVPGAGTLTRFDGRPARSFPQVFDYLADDLVAALVAERGHYETLRGDLPRLTVLPPVILGIGGVVGLYGLLMLGLAARRRD